MPVIDFSDARAMVTLSADWVDTLSKYINDPQSTPPANILPGQKLAFEIDKEEVKQLLEKDRLVGVLCMEPGASTLSVILVGVNAAGKPEEAIRPCETFPMLNTVEELDTVLTTYLTPENK